MTEKIRLREKYATRLKVSNPSDLSSEVSVLSGTKAHSFTDKNLLAKLYPEAVAREIFHEDVGG